MRKLILGAVFAALGGPAAAQGVPLGDCDDFFTVLPGVDQNTCETQLLGVWTAYRDTAAPSFDVAPSVGSVTSTGFTPSASIDESGVVYYIVVADGASAPTAAEVKVGQASGGAAALASASATVSSSPFDSNFSAITSLSASTAYDVYFVAQDDEGTPNLQSSVTKVDATTSAAAATTSAAPTSLVATPSDGQVSVAFTAPANTGGAAITDYEYQLDGGSWVSASTDSSPVVITGLTNGTSYSIKLRAVNSAGNGAETAAVSSTPATTSAAPTSLVATPSDGQVSVAFTAPANTGGAAITDYEYQLDGGSWVSASTDSSPVVITGLTNGTSYSIKLRAVNSAGNGAETAAVSSTPATTSAAPTSLVATPSDGQVSVAFTAPANTGGAAITDYEYQLDGGSWVSASTDSSPVVITGLTNGTSYSIKLRAVNSAGNGTASDAVSVDMPSPTSEFAQNEAKIRQVIVDNEQRSLSNILSANRRMTSEARSRLIDARRSQDGEASGLVSRNNVPFDVDGSFELNGTTVSSRGDFFAQQGTMDGTSRRLFFGDFDIQRDGDSGSTTATLTGRVAWERMLSDSTMLGYFMGGELAYSDIEGAFTGNQDRISVTIGAYAVHQLAEQVYLDGFLTFGAGRNNLEMDNDVLELESDYTTQTATIGAALSGVYDYGSYEFRPELAYSYGYTWIGNVGFTGRAYGLVDDTLSLDAGDVSIANLTLRPEVVWGLDGTTLAESNSQFSFAPRLICERVEAGTVRQDCGGGAEIGLSSLSTDGLTMFNVRVLADRVGNSTRTGFELGIQHRF